MREPSNGIPHIHASSDAELFFEYGREAAKDRLGQFVLLTRFARGTGAGLFGAGSLNSDIGSRSLAGHHCAASLYDGEIMGAYPAAGGLT